MNEQEWLTFNEWTATIRGFLKDKVSDRKFRLFAVACCRHIWHLLFEERSRDAVEVAERFADGMATETERKSAQTSGRAAMEALYPAHIDYAALAVVNAASEDASAPINADAAAFTAATAADDDDDTTNETKWTAERLWQAGILRDIVGNPFRPVTLHPTWRTSTVRTLVQAVYDDRQVPSGFFNNQRLSVLADALEEAGCNNADILNHCRQQGEHMRGCWVLDLILGKQ